MTRNTLLNPDNLDMSVGNCFLLSFDSHNKEVCNKFVANLQFAERFVTNILKMKDIGNDHVCGDIWQATLPLKVKHFLWLAIRDRIQSTSQLAKKKWCVCVWG